MWLQYSLNNDCWYHHHCGYSYKDVIILLLKIEFINMRLAFKAYCNVFCLHPFLSLYIEIWKYKYVPNSTWDILILNNNSLFIWNLNLTEHPVFSFVRYGCHIHMCAPLNPTFSSPSRGENPSMKTEFPHFQVSA